MPLNDLVKDYSLNTISNKTNIPIEVLEKLLNKEWEALQAPKAKGFIAIIEREFKIDLNELKQEANEFYATHKKEEPQRPIDLVDAQSASNQGGKVITTIATLVAIGLTLYAIWYYTNNSKDSNISESNSSSGLVKETIDKAKNLMGEDSNDSKKDSATQVDINTKEQSPKDAKENSEKNSNSTLSNTQEGSKKFDITSDVKKSGKAPESNNGNSLAISSNTQNSNEENKEDEKNEENKSSEKLKEDTQSILDTNTSNMNEDNNTSTGNEVADINDSASSETNISKNNISSESVENSSTNIEAPKTITIKPNTKRVWIGLYNLKTKRKVSVFAKKIYTYNTDGGDVVIVTGNSKFDITTDSGAKKRYTKGGKRYLIVSKDGIKEINGAEYKRVTKRRAW